MFDASQAAALADANADRAIEEVIWSIQISIGNAARKGYRRAIQQISTSPQAEAQMPAIIERLETLGFTVSVDGMTLTIDW